MSLPEKWDIDGNEDEIEIRNIDMRREKELEDKIEVDVGNLFKSIVAKNSRIMIRRIRENR